MKSTTYYTQPMQNTVKQLMELLVALDTPNSGVYIKNIQWEESWNGEKRVIIDLLETK